MGKFIIYCVCFFIIFFINEVFFILVFFEVDFSVVYIFFCICNNFVMFSGFIDDCFVVVVVV